MKFRHDIQLTCVPKLKNRAFNILYNLRNSAKPNLENAVNGISGVLDFKIFRGEHGKGGAPPDPPRGANAFGVRLRTAFGVRLTYTKS